MTELGAARDPTLPADRPARPGRWLIFTTFGLLLAACVIAGLATLAAESASDWASHTIMIRERAARLLGTVAAAEVAQRTYLLTHEDSYRIDYNAAKAALPGLQRQLSAMTLDNPAEQARLKRLAGDISARLAIGDRSVALARAGQPAAALALVESGEGRRLFGAIRSELDDIAGEEEQLYNERRGRAEIQRLSALGAIICSILAAAALGLSVGGAARRYRRALEASNHALLNEIHERERTEGQLRQAQKVEALGRLTGGVAHDFNNMLAIIIGNLDLALKQLPEDRPRRLVQNAMYAGHRAATLTQRLLAFSRLQPLEPKPADLNRSVTELSDLLHRTLGEHIAVEIVLGAGVWRAMVDTSQLESAIVNLAINARDAMPDGGKLTVETSNTYLDQAYAGEHTEVAPGQYVMLAITDTGAGMTPEVMAQAFDPFFTTKPIGGGTGLGLSQVHGFMKQSGGHVKLYSEVGLGTTVKLYLPRSLAVGEPSVEVVQPAQRDASGRAVLVVEDAAEVRQFVVDALTHLGYLVHEADGARAALEVIDSGAPVDLLLTDVVMPDVNGRKLADAALQRRPGLKVLYMTGYTRNAIVHNGVLDTGTHLLTKPFTVSQLDRALRTVFDGSTGAAKG